MINRYLLCMLISVSIASVSQILLKKGTLQKYDSVLKEYFNPWVIGGYGMLFLSMLLSVYAYSGVDFKNGPVIESLGNVFVPVLSWFVFGEKLSVRKIAGIFCIMLGIMVFYS
ncbi:MAG: EamA family transporter [Lachnospiraceae bacterium]|nr:EamA family transporter [Lachnospiraceae bacterium]MBQ6994514.1 EamA family transporter [Lachnospiraceae bacterium]